MLLDGQRLILVSGVNLSNGAKYRTEVESYSDITYKITGSYAYLEVKTKDGRILEYGSTDDSSIKAPNLGVTLFGLLSKVTDKNGNIITYSYDKIADQAEFYLSSIQYGGDRNISFTYGDRKDQQINYVAGISVNSRKILKQISTYIADVPVKTYQFNHTNDSLYSKLTEIIELGQENERYNSTLINYGTPDIYASEDLASLSEKRQGNKPIFADFNGDGKTDFISFPEKDSYTSSDVATLFLATEVLGVISFKKQCTIRLVEGFSHIIPADMNGDSKIDAVVVSHAPNGTYRYNYYLWENDKLAYNYLGFNTDSPTGIVGDFNGDGKFEILVQSNQKVFDGEGKEIASGGIDDWGSQYVNCFANNLYLSDFNGNGKTNLLVMNGTKCWVYELNGKSFVRLPSFETTYLKNYYFPYFGDFNGDGKTDILYQNVQAGNYDDVHILFSTGENFIRQSISDADIRSKIHIGDFNKDGKSDIFHMEVVNGKEIMKVGLYNGTGFTTKRYSTILSPQDLIVPLEYDDFLFPVADFNGDGRADFCCARFVDSYVIHTFDDEQTLLAKSITNGLGEYTSFSYLPITKSGVCSIDENLPFPLTNTRFPLYVVSSATVSGTNYSDYTTYSYKNPRIHKQGKGFLGFGEITAKNNSTAINTVTKYGYDNIHYYPCVIEQKSETKTGVAIQTTANEYATVLGSGKIFYPYIRKQTVTDHLKGTAITETVSNLEYGNPKTVVRDYGNGLVETTTSVFNNVMTGDKWILGLPASIAKQTVRSGASWTDKTVYEYNTNNQVSSKTIYTNTGQEQVSQETYTYDKYGNILTSALKPYSSSNSLTTRCQYSSNGVYETSITDPMGLTTSYTYNALGLLASTEDVRGNITTYKYDGLGRLKKTDYPDGTYASISRAWSMGAGGVYSLTKEASGEPTVTVYYDSRELELRTSQIRFDGSSLFVDNVYDNAGRLQKVSLPFKGSAPSLWDTYKYDAYGRLEQVTHASGRKEAYTYSGTSVTETKNGISIKRTYNAKDELIGTNDPGGSISYQLRPDGQPSLITVSGNVTTSFSYDKYGRQTEIDDPSIGVKTFGYDDAGNINYEKDANGKEKTMTYNEFGQLTKRTLPEYETTFAYDQYGSIESESSANGISKSYVRDALGRLSSNREEVDDHWFQFSYNYSSTTGLPESKVYSFSSGGNTIAENYAYQNGTLTEIKQNGQNSIWKLLSEDTFGHPTAVSTGPLNRTYSYDDYGFPTARKAVTSSGTVIQDFGTLFDPVTSNLKARGDNKYNKFEQFRYDNLNRLTQVYTATSLTATPSAEAENVYSYLANGNLASKSDAGVFSYDNASKPYAVTGLGLIGDAVPARSQQVTYTSFERPASIVENNYTAIFSYNGSGERVKMDITRNNKTEILRYYLNGSYEVDHTPAGDTERLYLGGDAYSAFAVLEKKNGSWNLHYICRNYLGSITQVTNSNGTLQQELSYDAWGRLRDPNTLITYLPDMEPELLLGRGYTGHEHLTMFGLVNMNARLYDPAVGRFLSPDPYVQAPDFTQSYNRFSYAMNNPLVYVDEDGEFLGWLVGGILLGSYIGASAKGGSLNPTKWKGKWWQGALWGGLAGGIGGAFVGSMWAAGGITISFSGSLYNLSFPIASATVSKGSLTLSLGTGLWGAGGLTYVIGKKKEDSMFKDDFTYEKSIEPLNRFNDMMQNGGSFYVGNGMFATSELLFSKDLDTWMGKDWKIRSQQWGGNQYTGGKYKFANKWAKPFRYGSTALGFYDLYSTFEQYRKKEIPPEIAIGDAAFGAGAIYGGFWGGWANIWYSLGKEYGPFTTVLKYQNNFDNQYMNRNNKTKW